MARNKPNPNPKGITGSRTTFYNKGGDTLVQYGDKNGNPTRLLLIRAGGKYKYGKMRGSVDFPYREYESTFRQSRQTGKKRASVKKSVPKSASVKRINVGSAGGYKIDVQRIEQDGKVKYVVEHPSFSKTFSGAGSYQKMKSYIDSKKASLKKR